MALETFNFPYHTPNDEYPGGSTIKFGRGYRFAARPPGPDEVIVHLNFAAMFVFQTQAGNGADSQFPHPLNIHMLEAFYKRHRMYQPFLYPHATLGTVTCRFNKPLIMPKTIKTSPGEVGGIVADVRPAPEGQFARRRIHQVEPFDLEFLIQP